LDFDEGRNLVKSLEVFVLILEFCDSFLVSLSEEMTSSSSSAAANMSGELSLSLILFLVANAVKFFAFIMI
jgi:hypothetical protein